MPSLLPADTPFGRRLRKARKSKEWSQSHLGLLLFGVDDPNVAAPRISRYERGMSKPNLKVIEKLAKLLDLPVAYFVATSDVVAEAILVISRMEPEAQRRALKLLQEYAEQSGALRPEPDE